MYSTVIKVHYTVRSLRQSITHVAGSGAHMPELQPHPPECSAYRLDIFY